jgi:hypothetical protein
MAIRRPSGEKRAHTYHERRLGLIGGRPQHRVQMERLRPGRRHPGTPANRAAQRRMPMWRAGLGAVRPLSHHADGIVGVRVLAAQIELFRPKDPPS